ncbi:MULTISPECIES: hypothetical protein [Paracoccus]|uniref:hypothetical protein n=1 Tax=Paracoccus TaxID=265 RepID=UPI000A0A117C|nr:MULTISPECIES: hypothetical protein [Paracoccus]SMG45383.1 hypothetical protein SAMN02746000_02769 [Paracoccus sp. J56]
MKKVDFSIIQVTVSEKAAGNTDQFMDLPFAYPLAAKLACPCCIRYVNLHFFS